MAGMKINLAGVTCVCMAKNVSSTLHTHNCFHFNFVEFADNEIFRELLYFLERKRLRPSFGTALLKLTHFSHLICVICNDNIMANDIQYPCLCMTLSANSRI